MRQNKWLNWFNAQVGVRQRLFLSHVLVMLVSVFGFIIVNYFLSRHFYNEHLAHIRAKGLSPQTLCAYVAEGFNQTWLHSTIWGVGLGSITAIALTHVAAYRITRPLLEMQNLTSQFMGGETHVRLPRYEILELNRLSRSFNHLADSLMNAEAKRQTILTDLVHELRTPLTVVRGYLEELTDGQIKASEQVYGLMIRETRRLEQLVIDLQELSKAETGRLSLNLQSFEIQPLMVQVVQKLSTQLLDDGPSLALDFQDNTSFVVADPDRTEQILVNLVSNAIRYTEKGRITLKSWAEGEYVWVAVVDTGCGISEEDLPYVFDRFWRAARSRKYQANGTGIGLTIVKRLVELQGGQIIAKSQLHQGSTFQFSLPRV